MFKKIVIICLLYNAAIFAGEGAAKSVQGVLKYDYIVLPHLFGRFHCCAINGRASKSSSFAMMQQAKPHVLEILKKRYLDKFKREMVGACRFMANGEIEELKDLIPESTKKAYMEEELAQMAQCIAKLESHSAPQTAAAQAPATTQIAVLSAAQVAEERKAEREKRKLTRKNNAQLTMAAIATAAAPAATAAPQVPNVSAKAAVLEKAKKDKELAAQQAENEANQKETERLMQVQKELRKAKGAEKQKKGKLFAPTVHGNAQDLIDQLSEANKHFVKVKKLGTEQEKTDLARKYQSIADKLAKLNHVKSAQAKAKYDELQKAIKQRNKKK